MSSSTAAMNDSGSGETGVIHFGIEGGSPRARPTLLSAGTRYEAGSCGEVERFPHVYGPIEASDVISVLDL